MGRKPKPSALRRLAGNPGKRAYNHREPVLPPPTLDVPSVLANDPLATEEWQRLLPILQAAHVITEGDRGTLIALCLQWSAFLTATAHSTTAGMIVRTPNGFPVTNPYLHIVNKALSNCRGLWSDLGLTPSSRGKVATTTDTLGTDPFTEFFDQPVN
jgi:P27 family predicted phage terminase small subunit